MEVHQREGKTASVKIYHGILVFWMKQLHQLLHHYIPMFHCFKGFPFQGFTFMEKT